MNVNIFWKLDVFLIITSCWGWLSPSWHWGSVIHIQTLFALPTVKPTNPVRVLDHTQMYSHTDTHTHTHHTHAHPSTKIYHSSDTMLHSPCPSQFGVCLMLIFTLLMAVLLQGLWSITYIYSLKYNMLFIEPLTQSSRCILCSELLRPSINLHKHFLGYHGQKQAI